MELKPGYKQTEAGVIPEEWKVNQLKHCCQKLNVSFVGTCEPFYTTSASGVLMLRTGNLQGDKIVLDDVKHVTKEFHARNRKSQVRAGDILIARHGNSGNAVPVPPEIDDVNALSIVILRTDNKVLDSQFASYCINSGAVRSQASEMLAGSTQVIINTKEVAKLRLPLPAIVEQRAIATVLSDVDALLGALDRLIAKKRDLKQAAMQQLLTGQTRLPGFSGEWEVRRLGEVAQMGSGGTPLSSVLGYYGGGIPWVSIADMTKAGKVILTTEKTLTSLGLANSAAQMFPAGTVLYAMYASLGECSIAGIPVCTSQAILGVRPIDRLDNGFLYYFLVSIKGRVKTLGQQGTQANLNKGIVQDFRLGLPSREEQKAITAVLSDMDAEIEILEARRAKTSDMKQAMMQELLTGRTRLI